MVRLKDSKITQIMSNTTSFQFHYGTIKSRTSYSHRDMKRMFQFHYGTIKRSISKYNNLSPQSGFNSTMVRLKVRLLIIMKIFLLSFNSTMVRLKVSIRYFFINILWSFNSTMVRLKDLHHSPLLEIQQFQFHYGTIKSFIGHFASGGRLCFNSTMVRLKAAGIRYYWIRADKFQFHYGTIKRTRNERRRDGKILFQFHYGTIKSFKKCAEQSLSKVSIPLWYD